MGRRGQSPAVKKAKGNPGRRKMVDEPAAPVAPTASAASAPVGIDTMPKWIDTAQAVAKRKPTSGKARATYMTELTRGVYEFIAPELTRMNLVKLIDLPALAIYCRAFAEYIASIIELDRDGMTYSTTSAHSGTIHRLHPATRMRKDALQTMKEQSEMLGITPMARYRLFQHMADAGKGALPRDPIEDQERAEASGDPSFFDASNPIGLLSNSTTKLN